MSNAMKEENSYVRHVGYCGKARCKKCRAGVGHGPYWYHYTEVDGHMKRVYVGKNLPETLDEATKQAILIRANQRQERPGSPSAHRIRRTRKKLPEQPSSGGVEEDEQWTETTPVSELISEVKQDLVRVQTQIEAGGRFEDMVQLMQQYQQQEHRLHKLRTCQQFAATAHWILHENDQDAYSDPRARKSINEVATELYRLIEHVVSQLFPDESQEQIVERVDLLSDAKG